MEVSLEENMNEKKDQQEKTLVSLLRVYFVFTGVFYKQDSAMRSSLPSPPPLLERLILAPGSVSLWLLA